jgi:hypothetical protein
MKIHKIGAVFFALIIPIVLVTACSDNSISQQERVTRAVSKTSQISQTSKITQKSKTSTAQTEKTRRNSAVSTPITPENPTTSKAARPQTSPPVTQAPKASYSDMKIPVFIAEDVDLYLNEYGFIPPENLPTTPQTFEGVGNVQCFWYDMSQEEDIVILGEFVVLEFKIKDTAKTGDVSKIEILNADFSNWGDENNDIPETLRPSTSYGTVTVGEGEDWVILPDNENFIIYANNVNGQPGDTVSVSISLAFNPGIVAAFFELSFDSDMLELVSYHGIGN